MNAANIRDVLHREPFEPFEIIMSSGERHVDGEKGSGVFDIDKLGTWR